MSKIICEICGTTYQDTAECCPICGCSRDAAADFLGEELVLEETDEVSADRGGKFSAKKKKEIFDFDQVNTEEEEIDVEEEENPYEEEEEFEEEPRKHNTFVVILLTVLIAALLIGAGFVFLRYFLPNLGSEETVPETTAAVEQTVPPTTELRIPCEGLWLTSGTAELSQVGGYFLLHVNVSPENTTDRIVYASADESIATVTEDGRITAVAEGETEVFITCGNMQLKCPVVCRFVEETEPATEETTPVEEQVAEETSEPLLIDTTVVLKLKQEDIQLGVYYEVQLILDCDVNPEDVEWISEHPHIASVDDKGNVKALQEGTTGIIAKYGNQQVQCIVRCGFY